MLNVYLPMDRRVAGPGAILPEVVEGAALFADISGFTPLTEALTQALGPRRGAEELTRQLNRVYDVLIAEVDRFGGSVIGFAGDAITCWFGDDANAPPHSAPYRAATCALAMQAAMHVFATIPIQEGVTVALAMKASIASGAARRFLVGNPDIQIMDALVGGTLTRMAAGEHLAQRGELVVDAATTAALGDLALLGEWRAEEDGPRFVVVMGLTRPADPTPWPPPPDVPPTDLRPWILPQVYARLSENLGEFLTELRPATVLFLRFTGIDFDGDPDAGKKLDAYIRRVQMELARHGGVLLQLIIGDKGSYLYAAFGAPIAHEDDTRRAIYAALALRETPADLSFIQAVQIGISQGTLRTGAYGGRTRRTYGVLGDEVNLAARLMQRAAPGEILVAERVQRTGGEAFVWEALPPMAVKGKSQLVSAARLVRVAAPDETWSNRPQTAVCLAGRQRELAQMQAILAQSAAGAIQVLHLSGDVGVGKSHLAANLVTEAVKMGFQVGIGVCQQLDQETAYTPWRPIFRTLLGLEDAASQRSNPVALPAAQVERLESHIAHLNPRWNIRLPLLGDLLGLPIPDNPTTATFDARLRQDALCAFAVELVRARAQVQPLLLLLEDSHWMDEASAHLTLALARGLGGARVSLLLLQRLLPAEIPWRLASLMALESYRPISLRELELSGITELVCHRLGVAARGETVSDLALALIHTRSQGNPFFAEELVDTLRESGDLVQQAGEWGISERLIHVLQEANCLIRNGECWGLRPDASFAMAALNIPDSVHGAMLARLDHLPERPKLTLKVASVIGRVFSSALLARAHPARPEQKQLQEQLDLFEQRDFIHRETAVPDAVYSFKHGVTQEVAYETLLEAQKQQLHYTVGTAQEQTQGDAVEQLAYHFNRSTVHYKALFYLDKAARKAQRAYANETALSYYRQALALEEFWEWRKGQIEILHILGRRDEELAALHALEANPSAPSYEVAYLWGQYYEAISNYGQAQEAIEQALSAARDQANRINEANCLAYLGLIARRQGDYERAKDWYGQALVLFQRNMTYSPEEAATFAQVFNGLGIVQRQQGEFDAARASYEQALALSRQSGNQKGEAEALNGLGVTASYQRNFADALMFHRQALETRRLIGDRADEGTSLYNLAATSLDLGEYGQAKEYFLQALTIQQSIGNRWEESNVWTGLGVLYQELSDFKAAQDCLQHGLDLCRLIGDEAGEAYTLANLGLVARDCGQLEQAETLLTEGLQLAEQQNDRYLISVLMSYLSSTSLQANDFERARQRAYHALELRKELELHLSTTAELATLAAIAHTVGDEATALVYVSQTLALLEECQGKGPEFPHRDYFICYQILAATGDTHRAQAALQSAYTLVMERANKIKDAVWRQSFLENVPINRQIVKEAHACASDSRNETPNKFGNPESSTC